MKSVKFGIVIGLFFWSSPRPACAGDAPRPIAVWAPTPLEVRVVFDRPIAVVGDAKALEASIRMNADASGPAAPIAIVGARAGENGRVLTLLTDPHPRGAGYSLSIRKLRDGDGALFETAASYGAFGVEIAHESSEGDAAPALKGRAQTLDEIGSRTRTRRNVIDAFGDRLIDRPGTLVVTTQLVAPRGAVTLELRANRGLEAELGEASGAAEGPHAAVEIAYESTGAPALLSVRLKAGEKPAPLVLESAWKTGSAQRFSPIPASAFLLPWAPITPAETVVNSAKPDSNSLLGGSVERGALVFRSEQAKCSVCHAYDGAGGKIGPDLTSQRGRDPAAVYLDLTQPNATIRPEFSAYTVLLKEGGVAAGLVRAIDAERLSVIDVNAKEQVLTRSEIEEIRPSASSIMPQGLAGSIGEDKVRDLLAYLTQSPKPQAQARPAPPKDPPPARTRREVEAVIGTESAKAVSQKPLTILLVRGEKPFSAIDHPYEKWSETWCKILESSANVTTAQAVEWPSDAQWNSADVVVLYFWRHEWSKAQLAQIDALLARGGGLVLLHSALITDGEAPELADRFGFGVTTQKRKFLHAGHDVTFNEPTRDPIVAGLSRLHVVDEAYWEMTKATAGVKVIATVAEEGKAWPAVWTKESGKGRVFGTVFGHYSWTLEDPLYRVMAFRGIAWAGRDPEIRRWDAAAVASARIAP